MPLLITDRPRTRLTVTDTERLAQELDRLLRGQVTAVVTTLATVTVERVLSGVIRQVGSAFGVVRVQRHLDGAGRIVGALSGALTIGPPAVGISGAITVISIVQGTILVERHIVGSVIVRGVATGALTVRRSVSGAITIVPTISGQMQVRRPIAGTEIFVGNMQGVLTAGSVDHPLLDDLMASYEYTSGSLLVDSHTTGHTLTNNNSVTTATGIVGDAASFTAASNQYLSHADHADFSYANVDFCWNGWVRLTSKTDFMFIMSKESGSRVEYVLYWHNSLDRFVFEVWAASASSFVTANAFGAPALNTWYNIHMWHDAVNDLIGIRVNDTSQNTNGYASGCHDGSGTLYIGGGATYAGAVGLKPFDGRVDQLRSWRKQLTGAQITWLYNGGAGRSYADIQSYTG